MSERKNHRSLSAKLFSSTFLFLLLAGTFRYFSKTFGTNVQTIYEVAPPPQLQFLWGTRMVSRLLHITVPPSSSTSSINQQMPLSFESEALTGKLRGPPSKVGPRRQVD